MGLAGHVRDRQILVDHALLDVDHDERDVRALGRLERAQLRVVLDPLPLPAVSTQAGGVDEDEGALAAAKDGVDRVAGRPRTSPRR